MIYDRKWVYHIPLVVQCLYGWSDEGDEDGMGGKGVSCLKDEKEWRLPGLL